MKISGLYWIFSLWQIYDILVNVLAENQRVAPYHREEIMKLTARISALAVAVGLALSAVPAISAQAVVPNRSQPPKSMPKMIAYKECRVPNKTGGSNSLYNNLGMGVWKVRDGASFVYYLYPTRSWTRDNGPVHLDTNFNISHFKYDGKDTYASSTANGSAWMLSTRSGKSHTIYAVWKVTQPLTFGERWVQCGVRF